MFSSDSVGLQRVAGGGGGTGFGIYLGWIGRRAAGPDTGRIADTAPKDRQELRARRCRPLYTRWSERYDKVLLFIFESGANHVAHRGNIANTKKVCERADIIGIHVPLMLVHPRQSLAVKTVCSQNCKPENNNNPVSVL